MKRNDIVRHDADGWFYGRVVRMLTPDTALWICCGRNLNVSKASDLIVDNAYKGYVDTVTCYSRSARGPGGMLRIETDGEGWASGPSPSFVTERRRRLPSLRKLKQRAARYHGRNVWKTAKDYRFLSGEWPADAI